MGMPVTVSSRSPATRARAGTAQIATLLACGLLLVFTSAGWAGTLPGSLTSALAPSIPPQPGAAPGTCTRSIAAADTWTKLVEETASYPDEPAFQVNVDPWRPCLMYQATSSQALQRSLDSGATWQPVFHDAAASPSGAPFAGRDLQVARPDALVMAETGNGDAVLRTDDQGHTWRLADSGLEGKKVESVDVAPGHPDVMYATVDKYVPVSGLFLDTDTVGSTEPFGLYVSQDGGASWSPALYPTVLSEMSLRDIRARIQVDPDNPGHVWLLVNGWANTLQSPVAAIFESSDYGLTWANTVPFSRGLIGSQLLVVRTPTHGLRLYLNSPVENAPSPPLVSADAGVSWTPMSVAPLTISSLAADPADPDTMIYAGYSRDAAIETGGQVANAVNYDVTYDSWDHVQAGAPMEWGQVMWPSTPLGYNQPTQRTSDPTIMLQADRFGDFYLLLKDLGRGAPVRQDFYRLTPVGTKGTGAGASSGPGAGGASGSSSSAPGPSQAPGQASGPPPPAFMRTLRGCNLPLSTSGADQSGTLTFDGDSLLYTHSADPAGTGTGAGTGGWAAVPPYTGTIFRMDPRTCTENAPLSVSFDPNDLAQVERRYGAPPGSASKPQIDTLAYDANHDTYWMSIAQPPGNAGYAGSYPVFSAAVDHGSGAARSAVHATLRFFSTGGNGIGLDLLAYDFTDNTLWSRTDGVHYHFPGHIGPDGTYIPSCWDSASAGDAQQVATWVLEAPGRLYVQSEDDVTVWEVDDSTCRTIRTFTHRKFGEPPAEDEQMACDSLTFGTDRGVAPNEATSAIWLRDANTQQVIAYAIPDGRCPYPTITHYLGSSVATNAPTQFCAQLLRRGITKPIARRPMLFSLAGTDIGSGITGSDGVACVDHKVNLPAGPYPVVARFLGDDQYLPSDDTGTLTLAAPGVTTLGTLALPIQPPSGPGQQLGQAPEPAPASQAQAAEQAQAQAQSQSQAQAQAQAQSQSQAQAHTVTQVQPGLMMQPQRRAQVVTQEEDMGGQAAYQASALRRTRASAIGVAVAFLTFGFGVLGRRPRWALARRRVVP